MSQIIEFSSYNENTESRELPCGPDLASHLPPQVLACLVNQSTVMSMLFWFLQEML
jgi:hypothetical protein